ncbi:hypothetical protein BOTBODRAFT_103049, partial [Botryobasidium botryosum FD-172 SS1]
LFGDDVSGNKSKSWNKHISIYMAPAGLDHSCLTQEYFICYVSTSQSASQVEQFAGIQEQLKEAQQNGIKTYDAEYKMPALSIPYVYVLPADGPAQSEWCSHPRMNGKFPCRICKARGKNEFKKSEAGLSTLLRTIKEVHAQLKRATELGAGTSIGDRQSDEGVKDRLAQHTIEKLVNRGKEMKKDHKSDADIKATLEEELRKIEEDVRAHVNPILSELYFDVHLDTPGDLLHLVLLGIAKYIWRAMFPKSNSKLTLPQQALLKKAEAIFASLSQDAVGEKKICASYVIQYRGSLIGCQL